MGWFGEEEYGLKNRYKISQLRSRKQEMDLVFYSGARRDVEIC